MFLLSYVVFIKILILAALQLGQCISNLLKFFSDSRYFLMACEGMTSLTTFK